jgi:hypothetical protein
MKNTGLYLLTAFLMIWTNARSQSGTVLNLSAPDSCAFLLNLNDQPANSIYSSSITLHGLQAGKTTLTVRFMNPVLSEIKSSVTLKPGIRHNFYVQPGNAGLKIISLDEYPVKLIEFQKPDSIELASPSVGYTGATGCSAPIDDADFDNLMGDVLDTPFQNAKLGLLTQIVSSHCLETSQLTEALGMLDLEEHRMQLMETATGHIFDLERSSSLEDLFFLESSKQRIRLLLGNK